MIITLIFGTFVSYQPQPPTPAATQVVAPIAVREDKDVAPRMERPPHDPARSSKTVAFWRRRVERDPSGARAWTELAAAHLARHHESGSLAEAVEAEKVARKAVELRAGAAAMTILGRALLSQHRFPEALAVAEKAVRVDPSANKLLCDVLVERGEMDKARVAFTRVPADTDPLDRLALEARMYEAEGRDDALLATLRELRDLADALPQLPHELAAWYHVRLGHALIDRGHRDQGRESCRAALAIVPSDPRALVGLAEAEAAEGRWEEALKLASEASAVAPGDFEALQMVAVAHRRLGHADQSERAFDRLRKLADSAPRVYDRHYARSCAEHNRDLVEGLRRAEADLALRRDALAYDTLALVLHRLGRDEEAHTAIELALKVDPNHPEVRKHADEIARARRPAEVGYKKAQ
jgi:Flp pilus assembly protein TadD